MPLPLDVEHEFEGIRVGRIEEADHIYVVLEVGVQRVIVGTRSDGFPPCPQPAHFFIFSRPMKSRLPSGTPLVRRMS